MDADTLVRAIRAALDETERDEATRHEFGCAVTDPAYEDPPRDADLTDIMACSCPVRGRLRRVAADLRVLERHLPELGIQRAYYCRRCHVPVGDPQWPCDEIRDLCDRLGINLEGECQ